MKTDAKLYVDDVEIGEVVSTDLLTANPKAKVEIIIAPGQKAIPKGVRINGWRVPSLRNVSVEYSHDNARTVILEILATDLIEVPQ